MPQLASGIPSWGDMQHGHRTAQKFAARCSLGQQTEERILNGVQPTNADGGELNALSAMLHRQGADRLTN
jgi:hypothetical protein